METGEQVQVLDQRGKPINVGALVTIKGHTSFTDYDGIVLDAQSDHEPEDGPVAVFFDREVEDWMFFPSRLERWRGPNPTPENYRDCPRVVCFEPEELLVISEVSVKTLVRRTFSRDMQPHTIYEWKFSLQPNTHSCQFVDCKSGELATERTLVNVWGSVSVVYACPQCHSEKNGMCTDSFELKRPLPGAPPL